MNPEDMNPEDIGPEDPLIESLKALIPKLQNSTYTPSDLGNAVDAIQNLEDSYDAGTTITADVKTYGEVWPSDA